VGEVLGVTTGLNVTEGAVGTGLPVTVAVAVGVALGVKVGIGGAEGAPIKVGGPCKSR
jgi:hypothetical protein